MTSLSPIPFHSSRSKAPISVTFTASAILPDKLEKNKNAGESLYFINCKLIKLIIDKVDFVDKIDFFSLRTLAAVRVFHLVALGILTAVGVFYLVVSGTLSAVVVFHSIALRTLSAVTIFTQIAEVLCRP